MLDEFEFNLYINGLAIGLSPLLLGLLADNLGIVRGFLLVPFLIVCAFIIVTLVPSRNELAPEEK